MYSLLVSSVSIARPSPYRISPSDYTFDELENLPVLSTHKFPTTSVSPLPKQSGLVHLQTLSVLSCPLGTISSSSSTLFCLNVYPMPMLVHDLHKKFLTSLDRILLWHQPYNYLHQNKRDPKVYPQITENINKKNYVVYVQGQESLSPDVSNRRQTTSQSLESRHKVRGNRKSNHHRLLLHLLDY